MNAASRARLELAPPDPVIEAFEKDVDRTLLRQNLRLTPDERVRACSPATDLIARSGSLVESLPSARGTSPRGNGRQR